MGIGMGLLLSFTIKRIGFQPKKSKGSLFLPYNLVLKSKGCIDILCRVLATTGGSYGQE